MIKNIYEINQHLTGCPTLSNEMLSEWTYLHENFVLPITSQILFLLKQNIRLQIPM